MRIVACDGGGGVDDFKLNCHALLDNHIAIAIDVDYANIAR